MSRTRRKQGLFRRVRIDITKDLSEGVDFQDTFRRTREMIHKEADTHSYGRGTIKEAEYWAWQSLLQWLRKSRV